jgi:membrane-bound lytic murein transglycosylase D
LLLTLPSFAAAPTLRPHQATGNVWDVLRKEFSLNHEVTRAEVQTQIRYLASHPNYVQDLARKSEPYIYHIVTEIKKRHLPGEIALIPMIESSFDPFAYSGAGAAGLWQLMPGTGTELGLKQDWWYDGRRSIGPSTNAALNYLAYLKDYFNSDWILAFAAYDYGEGALSKIIASSHQTRDRPSFWSLNVPQETKAYIPRLLALAEVIQYPERYHLRLPEIAHTPYFEEVNIGSQIDLNHAAKLAGISYKELIKLNPGFNRWATAPYQPFKLLIPADRVDDFSRKLAHVPQGDRVSWTRHAVRAGDDLSFIAQKYHTTVNLIKELNQLKSNHLKKGDFVLIPSNNPSDLAKAISPVLTPPPLPHFIKSDLYKVIHIVQNNESYVSISRLYGIDEKTLKIWNQIAINEALHPGQQLIIWKKNQPSSLYTIKSGDKLIDIAKRNNTKTAALLKINPQLKGHVLKPGQRIRLG